MAPIEQILFLPPFRGWGQGWARGWGLLLLLFLSSCTKVIDVNLNNASKKYVIEGTITDEPGYCQVKITQTVNFSDPNNFPAVSGAIVTVSDNNGTPVTLAETSAGIYQTGDINGTIAHHYTLSV